MLPQIGNAPSNREEINTPKETPSFRYAPSKVSGMLPQIGNAPSNREEINTPKETPSFRYASRKVKRNTPKETPSFRNASRNSREKKYSEGNTIFQECFPKLKGKVLKSHSPLKSNRSSIAKTNDNRGAC